MIRRAPISTLFPYTTLFRSGGHSVRVDLDRPLAWLIEHPPANVGAGQAEAVFPAGRAQQVPAQLDRKSTRLNSSHGYISYAVFCLKKKKRPIVLATEIRSLL